MPLTAKYPTTCGICASPVKPGDEISKVGGKWAHVACAAEGPGQAAIPLTGWHTTKSFSGNRVPTLVVGSENDTVAPVGQQAEQALGAGGVLAQLGRMRRQVARPDVDLVVGAQALQRAAGQVAGDEHRGHDLGDPAMWAG